MMGLVIAVLGGSARLCAMRRARPAHGRRHRRRDPRAARRDPIRRIRVRGGRASAALGGGLAHRLERLPDQARDVHLRDADPLSDLRLGHVLDEAHLEDHALPLGREPSSPGASVAPCSTSSYLGSSLPDDWARSRPPRRRRARCRARPARRRPRPRAPPAPPRSVASMCSAISAVVGDRPSWPVSAGIARFTLHAALLDRARHAMVQPVSRK